MLMLTCVRLREQSAKGLVRRSNILKVGAMELERINMSVEREKHEGVGGRKRKRVEVPLENLGMQMRGKNVWHGGKKHHRSSFVCGLDPWKREGWTPSQTDVSYFALSTSYWFDRACL